YPRSGVTLISTTSSASPSRAIASSPGSPVRPSACPRPSTMMPSSPEGSSPRPSSSPEQIMPSEVWPYVFRAAIAKSPGSTVPGSETTTRSPSTKLCAPQMMPRLGRSSPGCGSFGSSASSLCSGPTSTRTQLMVLPFFCGSLTSSSTRPTTSGPVTCAPNSASSSRPTRERSVATSSAEAVAGSSTCSPSQVRGMRGISDLRPVVLGEADVALHHVPHVRHAVAQHEDSLDPEAEGEALVLLGVHPGGAQHVRVDHAAAAHLDPARAAADAAVRVRVVLEAEPRLAGEAAEVHL